MVSQRNGLEFPLSLSCLAVGLSSSRAICTEAGTPFKNARRCYTSGAEFQFLKYFTDIIVFCIQYF